MQKPNKYNFFKDLDHEWVRAQNFENSNVSDWLVKSKLALENYKGPKPMAWVLDLDSTLFCVSHRLRKIFWEFVASHAQPEAWWWNLLEGLGPEEHRYGVRITFQELLNKSDRAGAFDRSMRLWKLFEKYWNEGFFSNRQIAYDRAYPGARDFVQQLYDMGFHVVYLTGRDRPRTMAGTYAALKANHFPLGERAKLLIKPHADMTDVVFKQQVSDVLRAQYEVFALLDNEPENLVMFAKRFPLAEIIFFHSIMSPRIPAENYQHMLGHRKAWLLDSYEAV